MDNFFDSLSYSAMKDLIFQAQNRKMVLNIFNQSKRDLEQIFPEYPIIDFSLAYPNRASRNKFLNNYRSRPEFMIVTNVGYDIPVLTYMTNRPLKIEVNQGILVY